MKRSLEDDSNTGEKHSLAAVNYKKIKKSHDVPKTSVVKSKSTSKVGLSKTFKKKIDEKNVAKGGFAKTIQKELEQKKPDEKLNWNEIKEKQKLLRKKRREKRIHSYAISDEAKKIFEDLRCHKCPSNKRLELAAKLHNIFSGKINNIVKSHDMARMVQWLIKVGSSDVKTAVINEVLKDSIALSTCQYSNHIIKKIIKYGGKNKINKSVIKKLLNTFYGNVVKLLGNKYSAPILEELYWKYASTTEKGFMRQELFSDLFRGARNPNIKDLKQAIEENKSLKNAILKSTKTILLRLINKQTALSTNLMADVLWDYLQHCENTDKEEVLELLRGHVRSLLQTKCGAEIAMNLLWISTPKIKKAIIKDLKSDLISLAKTEPGSAFLRSLFDSVDDTVLLRKAVIHPLIDSSEDLVVDDNGRKVILYLVAHRDTAYFHPSELDKYKKADESAHVKKDINVRLNELLSPCVDSLLSKISEKPDLWLSDGKIGLVTLAILKKATGDKAQEAFCAVAKHIVKNTLDEEVNRKLIEDSGVHMVLKKLIKHDSESGKAIAFCETFVHCLNKKVLSRLLLFNRGCFLIVFLIETGLKPVLNSLKEKFKEIKMVKKLENAESQGAEILKRLIEEKKLL